MISFFYFSIQSVIVILFEEDQTQFTTVPFNVEDILVFFFNLNMYNSDISLYWIPTLRTHSYQSIILSFVKKWTWIAHSWFPGFWRKYGIPFLKWRVNWDVINFTIFIFSLFFLLGSLPSRWCLEYMDKVLFYSIFGVSSWFHAFFGCMQ